MRFTDASTVCNCSAAYCWASVRMEFNAASVFATAFSAGSFWLVQAAMKMVASRNNLATFRMGISGFARGGHVKRAEYEPRVAGPRSDCADKRGKRPGAGANQSGGKPDSLSSFGDLAMRKYTRRLGWLDVLMNTTA